MEFWSRKPFRPEDGIRQYGIRQDGMIPSWDGIIPSWDEIIPSWVHNHYTVQCKITSMSRR